MRLSKFKLTSGLLCVYLFSGCASSQRPTAFLGNDAALLRSGHYFASEYTVPDAHWTRYSKVQVLPVTLDYFSSSDVQNVKTVAPLAPIMKKQFEDALKSSHAIISSDSLADGATLIIEPALVQTSGSYNFLNVDSNSIGGAVTSGTTSFEVRLKDGGDGHLLGLIAEKRKSRGHGLRLHNDTYVTPYPHAEAAFHKWAEQLAAMLASK